MTPRPTIIRAPRSSDNPYFILSRAAAQDDRLSWAARGLLTYLLSKPDDWRIDVKDLQQQCGRDKVYAILTELKQFGYLELAINRNEKNAIVSQEYRVHETPLPEKPDTETPETAEPDPAKPDSLHIRELQITEGTKIQLRFHRQMQLRQMIQALIDLHSEQSGEKKKVPPKKKNPPQPHVALIEAHHEGIPEEFRPPGKPNISAGCIAATALLEAGATGPLIAQFMAERYPGYLEWATKIGAPKVMSLEHIRKNFKAWLSSKKPKQERILTADDYLRAPERKLPTAADYGIK